MLKAIFIVIEKSLKIIAIFIIAISASILFLITSLFLFSSTFGLKESPAFQEIRDQVAEDLITTLEEEHQKDMEEAESDNKET